MIKKIRKILDNVGKWINDNKFVFLVFFAVAIVTETLGFIVSSDVQLFLGVLLYWYFGRIGWLKSTQTFQLILILLLVMFLSFLVNGASVQTERLAVWFVVFFGFGIVQQWREISS